MRSCEGAVTPEERAVLEAAEKWAHTYDEFPLDAEENVDARIALNAAVARMLKARGEKT